MTDQVIITDGQLTKIEVTPQNQSTVELGLTTIGIRGPQGPTGPIGPTGPPGPNNIGGFPVVISNAQEKDMLQLKSWEWRNIPQELLTDGGNF